MFSPSTIPSTTLSLSIYICIYYTISLPLVFITITISSNRHLSLHLYIYLHIDLQPPRLYSRVISLIATTRMDMLRSTCFYFLFIVFAILSRSRLCDSRHLGHMEKKLSVNRDHLIKNNEEITKLELQSTNKTNILSREAHAVVNHGKIKGQTNGKRTKDDHRVKRASDKTLSSKNGSRTWKIPTYSKNQPRSDQEHPAFNLDYMQPTTHPPHHN